MPVWCIRQISIQCNDTIDDLEFEKISAMKFLWSAKAGVPKTLHVSLFCDNKDYSLRSFAARGCQHERKENTPTLLCD